MRGSICRALLGDAEVVPTLIDALDDDAPDEVFLALSLLGPAASAATARLLQLSSPSARVTLHAVSASDGPGGDDSLVSLALTDLDAMDSKNAQYQEGWITSEERSASCWRAAVLALTWSSRDHRSASVHAVLARLKSGLVDTLDRAECPWFAPLLDASSGPGECDPSARQHGPSESRTPTTKR